ncbi:MAG TPA: paraquat-inducible protein A [Polyangia bacterium]
MSAESILICPECDGLQRWVRGARVVCFRCGAVLDQRSSVDARERAAAFTLAALPLFVAANALPLVRVDGAAGASQATVLGAAAALGAQGWPALALLVLLTGAIVPALQLGSAAYLLARARAGHRPGSSAIWLLRLRAVIGPWAQIEILLGGLVVVLGKLASVLPVAPGVGLPCLMAALLLERAARPALEPRRFWEVSP